MQFTHLLTALEFAEKNFWCWKHFKCFGTCVSTPRLLLCNEKLPTLSSLIKSIIVSPYEFLSFMLGTRAVERSRSQTNFGWLEPESEP